MAMAKGDIALVKTSLASIAHEGKTEAKEIIECAWMLCPQPRGKNEASRRAG